MHIPNGFLDPVTAATTTAVSAGVLAYGWQRLRQEISRHSPLTLGMVAAFIFAAQTVNYAIGHHTSGHLIGAMLAVVVCGPWAAGLLMASIIGVQSLFFHDGGTLALGANILNMAVIATAVSHAVYQRTFEKTGKRRLAMVLGAWLSVVAAAGAAAMELAIAGTSAFTEVLPAMLGWHSLIGAGEAIITLACARCFLGQTGKNLNLPQVKRYAEK
ncbi:energy-coupling factor ABC transporter permease [Desulforamulus hydrothermalis]|uniref:Cobalamin (Vitamin B12) biosynthesis CbiM protein n=1 Tax=Desulforamulus hydrothermalis Lam5 = DSM 18033 TaxID=1121428 RepID=K8DWV9_9FIRM|nr:energy-coupling factor ABC transporter permease [Desulforamulus hydrothermalis]CCO06934.1 Cobalamin (Vitamin B12) biosynthesis CbiM protein [Desulforamulus hydrothermalis Lam5 = DSM 18033]SHG99194.1 cobalt/nickel transport system permease protein [Desulforamulus hydrothermalis Lam5 = DSM 18033]